MANDFVKEFFGGLGSAAGSVVGIAAGAAHAAGRLVTGSDLSDAAEGFGETFEACVDGGVEIGEEHGPELAALAVGIAVLLSGRPHNSGRL